MAASLSVQFNKITVSVAFYVTASKVYQLVMLVHSGFVFCANTLDFEAWHVHTSHLMTFLIDYMLVMSKHKFRCVEISS